MALEVLDISAHFKILVWKCWQEIRRRQISEKKKKIVHTESQTFVSSLILLLKKKAADKTKIQKKIEVLAGASGAEQQVSEEKNSTPCGTGDVFCF